MDNNNPITQPPPTTQSAPASAPVQVPPTPDVNTPSGDSNKIVLYFLIGIVVIALLIGGAYLIMSRQQQAEKVSLKASPEPTVQVTPQPQNTVDALDRDLSAVNAENIDIDLSTVDQDLEQL